MLRLVSRCLFFNNACYALWVYVCGICDLRVTIILFVVKYCICDRCLVWYFLFGCYCCYCLLCCATNRLLSARALTTEGGLANDTNARLQRGGRAKIEWLTWRGCGDKVQGLRVGVGKALRWISTKYASIYSFCIIMMIVHIVSGSRIKYI